MYPYTHVLCLLIEPFGLVCVRNWVCDLGAMVALVSDAAAHGPFVTGLQYVKDIDIHMYYDIAWKFLTCYT